ncbi:hypothetical protein GTA28_22335 [Rhodococcus hoagii]|nr:hypothetical protein [Prescottella equi]NKZ79574.1 hypothetical protein [Prescottella equi]
MDPKAGLPPAALADPSAQVAAAPGVVPESAPPYGDMGDWGRWGAVATGTTLMSGKVSTHVTQPLKDNLASRYQDVIRFQNSSPEVQARVRNLQAARPSAINTVKEGTAGARSVGRRFAGNVATKTGEALAKRGAALRTVGKLGGVAARVGARMGPSAASMGARLGLRLAAFAIPGPGWAVGLAVLAASWLFDSSMRRMVNNLVGKLFGVNNSPALDTPPEPPRTQFLPLTHDGDRDSVIDVKDAEMVAFNNSAFAFDPTKVWHPFAPAIETTPTFEESTNRITGLIQSTTEVREELDAIVRKYRGDQTVEKAAQSIQSAIDSLDQMAAEVLPPVANLIAATATDTNDLYMKLRDANSSARQEISNSGAGLLPWTADVDASNMGQLPGEIEKFVKQQNGYLEAVNGVFESWKAPTASSTGAGTSNLPSFLNPPREGAGSGRAADGAPGLSSISTPAPRTPEAGSSTSKDTGPSKQQLVDSLKSIATPANGAAAQTAARNPLSDMMNNPMMSPMNNPMNRMNSSPFGQMGANPFGQMGANPLPSALQQPAAGASGKADPAKLESKLRDLINGGDKAKNDKAKDTVAEQRADGEQPETPAPAPEPAPEQPKPEAPKATAAAASLPAALGIDTQPADAPAPDAPQSKSAQIDGKKIEFEDPRSARMAEILKPMDGSSPMTVQEAATKAGYTLPPAGEPIGEPVSAADLRPGDLIMGAEDRNGLYLGDGKVLTGGEVRPVGDIAHFTDDGQGIFRLDDAGAAPADGDTVAVSDNAGATSAGTAGDEPAAPADPVPAGDSVVSEPADPAPAGDTPGDAPSPAPGDEQAGESKPTDTISVGSESAPASEMPLPRTSIPTSDTSGGGAASPATPSVPVGD